MTKHRVRMRFIFKELPWLAVLLAFCLPLPIVGFAQETVSSGPQTRQGLIEQERLEKQARLWPERESPIARMAIEVEESGLLEGFASDKGINGLQFPLGGMRSGQGMSFGVGYRRSDLFRDRIDARTTARFTFEGAYMLDARVVLAQTRTERGFFDFYTKFERSPQMDYYGPGPDSSKDDRTSFLLQDFGLDFRGGWQLTRRRGLRIGGTIGLYSARTDSGSRSDFPSIEEIFNPATTPGLLLDTYFVRGGAFIEWDTRNFPNSPRKGGRYLLELNAYSDQDVGLSSFKRLDAVAEQYIPYFNQRRVIVFRLAAALTYTKNLQRVPFYLQPVLGGNEFLRGFERYRFYDNNSIIATVEHRWHIFSGMVGALFAEAGKVEAKRSDIDFTNMEFSGGIGFRFKIEQNVIMRIDQAWSSEGYRFMWTFNNVF